MESITISAPAKLNLALSVGPPGPSGMHPVASWMATIDLHDELTLHRLPHDRLSRYAIRWHRDAKSASNIDWPLRDDLAVRAHHALERQVGRHLPVQMKLEKRIAAGAGLGGGSSDAAAMLRGLCELFDLRLPPERVHAIASRLGADVPFFLQGGSAFVGDEGDAIQPHTMRHTVHAAVVMPDFPCATAAVYSMYDRLGPGSLREERVRILMDAPALEPAAPFNDLAAAAIAVAPALRDQMDRVAALAERPAHITGSGSAFFVICDDAIHAEALAHAIESQLRLRARPVQTTAPAR